MNNTNSLLKFQALAISVGQKKSLKGGGGKFKNLLSAHLNLAQARENGDASGIAGYRDDLDCLEFASLQDCCGNGLGLW